MPRKPPTWERLPNESTKAYAAFLAYRNLGPSRSLGKAYRASKGHREGIERAHLPGYFRRWCVRYSWLERAVAWDDASHRNREKLTHHFATKAENDRYRRHFASVEKFDPILVELLERVRTKDLPVLDVVRLLAALRELEGALQAGFGPRLGSW